MAFAISNVIKALVVTPVRAPLLALVVAPVVAIGQVLPTRVAPTGAHDSLRRLSHRSYPFLSPYSPLSSYSYSSSSFAGIISGPTERLTPSTALAGDSSRSSNHRTRNTILGATIALVAGAYIGGRVGAKAHPCGDHECAGPPLDQLFAGIGGGLLGMVAGIVVGSTVSDGS